MSRNGCRAACGTARQPGYLQSSPLDCSLHPSSYERGAPCTHTQDKPPTCFFTLKKNLHKHSSQHFLTLSETLSPLLCPQGIYLTNFELQASSSFQLTKIMFISDSFSRPDADMGLQKTYTSRGKSHKYYKTHQVPTHTHNTVRTAACNFSWCDFWERYFLLLHVLFSRFMWNYLQHYLQIFHIFFLSFYQLMDVTLPLLLLRAQWIQAVQVRTPCKTGATPRGEVCMKKKTNQPTSPSTSTKPTNDCLYR